MVVFVMKSGVSTHPFVVSRHVDVQFPSRAEVLSCRTDPITSPAAKSATPPAGPRTSSRGGRFGNSAAPSSLISEEWMTTLVQYVAALKKGMYDDAREEISQEIKKQVPRCLMSQLQLRSSGGERRVSILYGGQLNEHVTSHETLTRQQSIKRAQRNDMQGDENAPFLNSVYMHDHDPHVADEEPHLEGHDRGKLNAIVVNTLFQQARSMLQRESTDRRTLEKQFGNSMLDVVFDWEEECRFGVLFEETRAWKRLEADEVGHYLLKKRQSQDNARAATIRRATEELKSEKDALREEVLKSAISTREEVAAGRVAHLETLEGLISELPLQPNASNIDAEVARLVLQQRRQEVPEFFPGFE
jgi:hypothetical protein